MDGDSIAVVGCEGGDGVAEGGRELVQPVGAGVEDLSPPVRTLGAADGGAVLEQGALGPADEAEAQGAPARVGLVVAELPGASQPVQLERHRRPGQTWLGGEGLLRPRRARRAGLP